VSVRITWNDREFTQHLSRATARGLQRAGQFYHTACRRAVNKSNPRNRKTGKYDSPSAPGEPPRARTGFGRDNIVKEFNDSPLFPAVRVGVGKNAMYMFYLEVGTRRIEPRPWLVATLEKNRGIIGKLAATP